MFGHFSTLCNKGLITASVYQTADRWFKVKDGLEVSLFLGPLRRRSTCCQCAM